MSLKLCFNSEIHRVSKLPANYNALSQLVQTIFDTRLPSFWGIQYLDSDGDMVMLTSNEDLNAVLSDLASAPSKSIKLYIVERGHNLSQMLDSVEHYEVVAEEKPVAIQLTEVKVDELKSQEEPIPVSNTNGDKVELPEEIKVDAQEEKVLEEKPKRRGCRFGGPRMMAVCTARKLLKDDLSPEKKDKLQQRYAELMTQLSPEDKTWIEARMEEVKEKKRVKSEKRRKTITETVSGILKENFASIWSAFGKDGKEKDQAPKKLMEEFSASFETLPEEKRKEFNELMKGIPEKIMASMKAKTDKKLKKKEERSKSRKVEKKVLSPEEALAQKEMKELKKKMLLDKIRERKCSRKSRKEASIEKPEVKALEPVEQIKPIEEVQIQAPVEVVEKKEKSPEKKEKSPEKKEKSPEKKEKKSRDLSPSTKKKVDAVKEIFPDTNMETLIDFVSKNKKLSLEELIENYLAL